MKTIRFEPNTPCDFGEYRVLIEKNGKFHRFISYTGMSGNAMMDIMPDLRKKYPKEKGFKVTW